MRTSIARRLVRLNLAFYERFASQFAATRQPLPPGLRRALGLLGGRHSLLDLGCGDARVGRALASGRIASQVRRYVGVDSSPTLLSQPGPEASELPRGFALVRADLTAAGWPDLLPRRSESFAAAVCFAALFHLPGARRRLRLLRQMGERLMPGGLAVVSIWRFQHVPRLRRKIVPWEEIGLGAGEVDAGDRLLDWRQGGRGLRYVHHFEPDELAALCRRAGFSIVDSYTSDGATGDMSLFMVLERPPPD